MKKTIACLTAILMMMIVLTASAGTTITVTGTGETQVSADTAVISLGVSMRDKDALTAQQKVNELIAEIRKALTVQGVEEECINTGSINLYAIYESSFGKEKISAYNADSSLHIKVTDMDKVGAVIDEAFAAGANMLNGISFSAGNTEAARAESLKKAVDDAKEKAEALASASSLSITGINSITEGGSYSYANTVGNFAADMVTEEAETKYCGGTVVQAAKVIVSVTVSISYTAE